MLVGNFCRTNTFSVSCFDFSVAAAAHSPTPQTYGLAASLERKAFPWKRSAAADAVAVAAFESGKAAAIICGIVAPPPSKPAADATAKEPAANSSAATSSEKAEHGASEQLVKTTTEHHAQKPSIAIVSTATVDNAMEPSVTGVFTATASNAAESDADTARAPETAGAPGAQPSVAAGASARIDDLAALPDDQSSAPGVKCVP